jgi:hypothetical protein
MEHREQEGIGAEPCEILSVGAAQNEDHRLSEAFAVVAHPDTSRQLEVPVERYLHPGAVAVLDHHLRRAEADEVMDEVWQEVATLLDLLVHPGEPDRDAHLGPTLTTDERTSVGWWTRFLEDVRRRLRP